MKKFRLLLGLIAMLCVMAVNAQTKKFEATVIDELGEPCIGASVIVKGTTQGVMTGVDGSFSIDVPEGAEVEISYIGYVTKTINNFSTTTITLEEDRQQIEEVVVVGYGVQKKSHLTGAIATVPVDDIQDLSSGNLAASLKGLVNGVSVSGGESRPGQSASITVRAAGGITDMGGTVTQGPLYVIDGYIYPNDIRINGVDGRNLGEEMFNNLDAASIESISVLKDAAAAVYGSRAANGVILVTTKKGKEGAPQISYSGTVGIADALSIPSMLSAYQYGKLYNAIVAADDTKYDALDKRRKLFQKDELEAMKGLDYNLLEKYWSSAITHQHSVNLTGATEKVNYFGGVSYFNQDGNLGKLDYNRWTYRAGVDAKIGKNLKVGISVSGDYGKKTTPFIKGFGSSGEGETDYNLLLKRPRYIPEYVNGYAIAAAGPDPDASLNNEQYYHFNALQNNGDYEDKMTSNLNIGANIEYDWSWIKPLKGLTMKFSYSKSIQTEKVNSVGSTFDLYRMTQRSGSGNHLYTAIPGMEDEYQELLSPNNFYLANGGKPVPNGVGDTKTGSVERDMTRTDNYQINFTVAYNRQFEKHTVGALFSMERSEAESEFLQGRIYSPYNFGSHQSNSTDEKTIFTQFNRYEMGSLSYIGRINYAYDDKYLVELLMRTDASTKFAPKNYWGFFPSLSAGWVISKENWMQNTTWLDFLKLRASFGLTGRDNLPAWQWAPMYTVDGYRGAIFGTSAGDAASSRITLNKNIANINADAHWDKSYKMNVGIDWNVLNNRLGFNIDYYYQWDRDMLLPFKGNIPGTTGNQSASINYGELDSWGVEFTASWRDKINKDMSYRIQLSTGYTDNKVLVRPWAYDDSFMFGVQPGGRTDSGTWGMECIGMFRNYQDIQKYFDTYLKNDDGTYGTYMGMIKDNVRPGMLIYKDVRGAYNGDGTYNPTPDHNVDAKADQVLLAGRSNPYGFTLNLGYEWKGLSVTAQFSANWGGYSFISGNMIKTTVSDMQYLSMPSFWDPDNMYVYQNIEDGDGNVVVAKNQDGYYPNLAYSSVNSVTSSFWRISGARARLNRLTVAYTLPKKWTNAIGIGSCRINVTGQNLWDIYNPLPDGFMDTMSSYGSYPVLRKITIGLNINF